MSYVPEAGQYIFGCPYGEFEVSRLGDAAVQYALEGIERVYWNSHQKQWDRYCDPEIPGVAFRPYWWGDDDAPEREFPNLKIEGHPAEIRWYKHPGRGMSVSVEMVAGDWEEWLDVVQKRLNEHDPALRYG